VVGCAVGVPGLSSLGTRRRRQHKRPRTAHCGRDTYAADWTWRTRRCQQQPLATTTTVFSIIFTIRTLITHHDYRLISQLPAHVAFSAVLGTQPWSSQLQTCASSLNRVPIMFHSLLNHSALLSSWASHLSRDACHLTPPLSVSCATPAAGTDGLCNGSWELKLGVH
jgi:hypothetical protein